MITYIFSFVLILLIMLAMAVGLLFGKKGIAGTCNSLQKSDDEQHKCDVCTCNRAGEKQDD